MTTARTGRARTTVLAPPSLSVGPELEAVEQRLAELIDSREPRLTDISNYLIGSGGKRIRPAVALLAYRACGGTDADLADIIDVAVALELIHSASLLHDDIIDGSTFRRGRESALRKYGLAETLVAGDFLFGLAYRLCARFEEKLINWAVQACISLTEGEIMQGRFRHNAEVTLSDYIEIVSRKTASLFEAGARTAAHLARGDASTVEAMARAGHHVGLTFQIIDDVLDVSGAEVVIGKPIGIDLRDGNPSLPIVLMLESDAEVRELFGRPQLSEQEIARLLARVRSSPALRRAYTLAGEHAEQARKSLYVLDDSPHRDCLLWLIDQLLDRVS